jgi:nucleoside-diphosphate-sugar epimerase
MIPTTAETTFTGPVGENVFPWRELRILVTGGTGFIGRHLVKSLLSLGSRLLVVVGRQPRPRLPEGRFKYLALDLEDAGAVNAFCRERPFDLVIHLAGVINQATGQGLYRDLLGANLVSTVNLVEALQVRGVARFIHVGSNAEYGKAPCPQAPATRELPNSAYGLSKLAATRFVLAKALSESFPARVIRPFLVYGPGQPEASFLGKALKAARAGSELALTAGQQTRDFVSVAKVVSDVLTLASSDAPPGTVVNSCTGVETKLADVVAHLQAGYGRFKPLLGALPYRAGELMRSVGVPYVAVTREQAEQELFRFLAPAEPDPGAGPTGGWPVPAPAAWAAAKGPTY